MKTKLQSLFVTLALFAGVNQATAQSPVITSFSQNGVLSCSNLQAYSVATVEWASSLSGPWHTNWSGLDAVTADANGAIQVSVPMFYRVLGSGTNAIDTNTPPGMAIIPGGAFVMGNSSLDSDINDAVPVTVNVSSFYMDINLMSYGLWQSVYSWATISGGYTFDNGGTVRQVMNSSNYPVIYVEWYDAVKWCNARSQQAGLTPVYYTDPSFTQVYKSGDVDGVYANWSANGFRLPTEAEWEKAARGGLTGQRFPLGNTISESQANYAGDNTDYTYDLGPNGYNTTFAAGNVQPYTSPAGATLPNGYGLYDMAGNCYSWCWDWYASAYAGGTDPHGADSGSGHGRIIRGGSWVDNANYDRCASRRDIAAGFNYLNISFRCVRAH